MTNRDKIIIKDCGCRNDAATNIPLHFCDKHDPARLYHDVEEANRIILTLRQQNAAWVTIAKDIARRCRHKAMGRCTGCRGLAVCDVQGLKFVSQSNTQEESMDHSTLIDTMAERVGTTKVQTRKFFDELVGLIRGELQSGGRMRLNDLGTFSLKGRAPRKGTAPPAARNMKSPPAKPSSSSRPATFAGP